jgi:DNA-binding response OmpR family regulator
VRTRTQCEQDASADSAAARVLIVDDEPSVRKMITTLLSQAGVPCGAAANACEAVADAFFAVGEVAWQLIRADSRTASINKIICGESLRSASARALTSQVPQLEKVAN